MAHRILYLSGTALVAMACSACASGGVRSPATQAAGQEVAAIAGQRCEPDERLIFAGEVQDDFGLGIAVCQSGRDGADAQGISIRYSGEGGGRTVTCRRSECEGKIAFSHYVRPRFTIITLTWRDENGEQRIVETFNAEDEAAEPVHIVEHQWAAKSRIGPGTQGYPVMASTEPLSLLALEPWFDR